MHGTRRKTILSGGECGAVHCRKMPLVEDGKTGIEPQSVARWLRHVAQEEGECSLLSATARAKGECDSGRGHTHQVEDTSPSFVDISIALGVG